MKKQIRQNEAHLRRNKSRRRHAERGLVNLECQGSFVLPEITRMQVRGTHHHHPPSVATPIRSVSARPSCSRSLLPTSAVLDPCGKRSDRTPRLKSCPALILNKAFSFLYPNYERWWQTSCAITFFTISRDGLNQVDKTTRRFSFLT